MSTLIRGRLRIFGCPLIVRHEDCGLDQARDVFVTRFYLPSVFGEELVSETERTVGCLGAARLAKDMAALKRRVPFLPWSLQVKVEGEDWSGWLATKSLYSQKARGRFRSRYRGPVKAPKRTRFVVLRR